MPIDRDKFIQWAESRFENVRVSGKEIKLDSIFTDDYKGHLWCNTDGGKHKREYGVYRCWKTDNVGTLVGLVMLKDNCAYDEALEILGIRNDLLVEADKVLAELFAQEYDATKTKVRQETIIEKTIRLPDHTVNVTSLPITNISRIQVELHLKKRKLPIDGMMVAVGDDRVWEDRYKKRLIIPYYDSHGNLIYFNSRYVGTNEKALRYLGPTVEEVGVGKGDVLYFKKWPPKSSTVVLVEGEFCSISLQEIGIPAGAFGGSNLSDSQIDILIEKDYSVILGLDNDEKGGESKYTMAKLLRERGYPYHRIFFLSPEKSFKDWNDMYKEVPTDNLLSYIKTNIKRFDPSDLNLL